MSIMYACMHSLRDAYHGVDFRSDTYVIRLYGSQHLPRERIPERWTVLSGLLSPGGPSSGA